jgi:hypothetical protein
MCALCSCKTLRSPPSLGRDPLDDYPVACPRHLSTPRFPPFFVPCSPFFPVQDDDNFSPRYPNYSMPEPDESVTLQIWVRSRPSTPQLLSFLTPSLTATHSAGRQQPPKTALHLISVRDAFYFSRLESISQILLTQRENLSSPCYLVHYECMHSVHLHTGTQRIYLDLDLSHFFRYHKMVQCV